MPSKTQYRHVTFPKDFEKRIFFDENVPVSSLFKGAQNIRQPDAKMGFARVDIRGVPEAVEVGTALNYLYQEQQELEKQRDLLRGACADCAIDLYDILIESDAPRFSSEEFLNALAPRMDDNRLKPLFNPDREGELLLHTDTLDRIRLNSNNGFDGDFDYESRVGRIETELGRVHFDAWVQPIDAALGVVKAKQKLLESEPEPRLIGQLLLQISDSIRGDS